MKSKKTFIIALIINVIVSVIPIPHKTLTGTECPGYCYEYMPSYGFPFPLLTSNGIDSPIGVINTDILYFPYGIGILVLLGIFLINTLVFALAIKVLSILYEEAIQESNEKKIIG